MQDKSCKEAINITEGNMYQILLCDDEKDIVTALEIYLRNDDYKIFKAYNGADALKILTEEEIHLVLLDIMMPHMDGIAALTKLREFSNVPVILLTAKSEDIDKVLGLTVGADDYITKPFSVRELVARVKANIRKADVTLGQQTNEITETEKPKAKANKIIVGDLELDLDRFEVMVNDRIVDLTLREFEVLKFLAFFLFLLLNYVIFLILHEQILSYHDLFPSLLQY